MGAQDHTGTELRLWELANRQFGLLRFSDLVANDLSRNDIGGRLATRRLTRVHDLVFAFGHTVLRDEGLWLAAQWACGQGTVVSHLTAGAFHAMRAPGEDEPVHVSTRLEATSREGICVHRVRYLDRKDIFSPHPLLVTTIPRTLIDLADVLPWDEYREAADRLPKLRLDKVKEAQERAPGRRGAPLVRRLIEADDAHTKSEFERRFRRFSRAHSLPRPDSQNSWVAGHKADCHYAGERLVIELDGRAYHERRGQMRADRLRDADYQLSGHRILRLVWDDLHPDEARRTAERVRRMLAAGSI